MEELALEERLCDAMNKVQTGHLLMPYFRVKADHLGVSKSLNKSECVPNRWKINITTRFIWLRFDGKLEVVPLIDHILPKDVKSFAITLKSNDRIFTCIGL
jgi:hypothetical protein